MRSTLACRRQTNQIGHLRLPPCVPVIEVAHTSIDQNEAPYELTRFVMRGDLTGLLYDAPIE
jgi:GntR family transcriptional regulator